MILRPNLFLSFLFEIFLALVQFCFQFQLQPDKVKRQMTHSNGKLAV